MKQINKPESWEVVQCYKCKTILRVPKLMNMHSNYLLDCSRHYDKGADHES